MPTRLLVVDDDEVSLRLMRTIFVAQQFEVLTAADGPSGLDALASRPDVVLLDLHLPGLSGLEVLGRLKAAAPTLPVIMLTASRDVKAAVSAMHLGAFDYLTKPIEPEEVILAVRRALESRNLELEVQDLRRRVGRTERDNLASLMGSSAKIMDVIEQVETVAGSTFSVLILGETGTGKEVVAQAIHRLSDRHRNSFVALDCGAIPEALLESELFGHEKGAFTGAERRRQGRFQVAEGGTCLLDEVGNLPVNLQVKLLRVLESKEMQAVGSERVTPLNVRFLAATNHDLQARVADGAFRADLFFRLAQYTISVPPLRARADDVPFLADRFRREAIVELRRPVEGFAPEAMALLQAHTWPGNVRELRNIVRRAVLTTKDLFIRADTVQPMLGGVVGPGPAAGRPGLSLKERAEEAAHAVERQAIIDALREAGGNKSQAARSLKTDFKTLHVKMRQLGIEARTFTA